MRIRVEDSAARDRLAAALEAAGCLVRPVGSELELQHGRDDELTFFLRAWRARHPEHRLELVYV